MGCNNSKLPLEEPTPAKVANAEAPRRPSAEFAAIMSSADLAAIMADMTAEERAFAHLWNIFNGVDRDEDDSVSKVELSTALAAKDARLSALIKEAGLNEEYHVLTSLHTSKDGRVTWEEFHLNLKSVPVVDVKASALAHLRNVFDSTDVSIDGTVLKEELAAALAQDTSVEQIIQEAGFTSKYKALQPVETVIQDRITWEEFESHLHSEAMMEAFIIKRIESL